jgi:hypothetical protein
VAWIVRLVKIGAYGDEPFADVMTINRPDDLDDIANLGLTVADGKGLSRVCGDQAAIASC